MKIITAFWLFHFLLCSSIAGAIIEPSRFDSKAIDTALGQSEPGDTIQLREGVYQLNKAISVPSQRKLVGAGQAKTKLVFVGEKASVVVTLNGCEDVELAHLTLDGENVGLDAEYGGGIRLAWGSVRNRVEDNVILQIRDELKAGKPVRFRCTSTADTGEIVKRLWDFGEGIPELTEEPTHTFEKPGEYRVTLVVWDTEGLGARVEKTIYVALP